MVRRPLKGNEGSGIGEGRTNECGLKTTEECTNSAMGVKLAHHIDTAVVLALVRVERVGLEARLHDAGQQ